MPFTFSASGFLQEFDTHFQSLPRVQARVFYVTWHFGLADAAPHLGRSSRPISRPNAPIRRIGAPRGPRGSAGAGRRAANAPICRAPNWHARVVCSAAVFFWVALCCESGRTARARAHGRSLWPLGGAVGGEMGARPDASMAASQRCPASRRCLHGIAHGGPGAHWGRAGPGCWARQHRDSPCPHPLPPSPSPSLSGVG